MSSTGQFKDLVEGFDLALLAVKARAHEHAAGVEALHTSHKRRAWRLRPYVDLHYSSAEDALFAEFRPTGGERTQVIHDLLCVEFDGNDRGAMPTALCLEEFAHDPRSPAALVARKLLGETAWGRAIDMADDVDDLSHDATVYLLSEERTTLVDTWRYFSVPPEHAVGVRVGSDRVWARFVNASDGKGGTLESTPLYDHDGEFTANVIARTVVRMIEETDIEPQVRPVVVGIEIAGPVNHDTGVVEHYNKKAISSAWVDFDLGKRVRELTGGLPTMVINDAEALGTFEAWDSPGRIRARKGLLLISEGIGGALIDNGRVDRTFPMEIGNVPLEPDTGPTCSCGMKGCIEASAGIGAILSKVAEKVGRPVDLAEAIELAETDHSVLEVFNFAGDRLALGMAASQYHFKARRWVIYLPQELYAESTAASRAFVRELQSFGRHMAWKGFSKDVTVDPRLATPAEGAHGAGLAALDAYGVPVLNSPNAGKR